MKKTRVLLAVLTVILLSTGLFSASFAASGSHNPFLSTSPSQASVSEPVSDGEASAPEASHRLIVQLKTPSLAEWSRQTGLSRLSNGKLDVSSTAAQTYMAQLRAEQAAAITAMQAAVPGAAVASYVNERGANVEATYQAVFNGFAVDPGAVGAREATRRLLQVPGVAAVYPDRARDPAMYASLPLINVDALWNHSGIGGMANAGRGIKVASIDGGVHHAAPMFDGTGFDYPPDYPEGGLGDTANNNGKIIVSRAYFRPWDLPAPGDEATWPGELGTSHGVHTAGTAAGNPVTANYLGVEEDISGVAPGAWIMSYRVFYYSVRAIQSFYDVEGLAALQDIVLDGADVVNNSWGSGPTSRGGLNDPIDRALINAANAGIFVSMSAGNSGPSTGTVDHPSDEYINVAASTTTGTFAAGRLNVTAPPPVEDERLLNIPFATASFGAPLELQQVYTWPFLAAEVVNPANREGCNPWPAGTFEGYAAVISRGTCEFGVKVLNAEQAGAEFVVVHNHAAGGEELISMGPGEVGDQVTIPSVFVGYSAGTAMVEWSTAHGDQAELTLDTIAFQAGNVPDRIIAFSSRGPGMNNNLKPDIAAPGVNILSQGYTPGATGEARHLGFGQVSGTSMAAPHVAGAAALLRQIHPDWTPADIKSALMTTSRYLEIYNFDGSPAQPLDMGAGRLDLTRAADPGVILSPPKASFGIVPMGDTASLTIVARSVAAATETYQLSTLYTGDGFDATTELPGFTVSPTAVTLEPGESAEITVTFDSNEGMGIGHNQGYIIMAGETYHAHFPAWARVIEAEAPADILILDNDASSSLELPDYSEYYISAVEALGYTYTYVDLDERVFEWDFPADFLTTEELLPYRAVLYFTGDNSYPNGSFTVATPLSDSDMYSLNEYFHHGGTIISSGQDLSWVMNDHFLYDVTLGAARVQDSINQEEITPTLQISSTLGMPLRGVHLDLSGDAGDGADNQFWIDEITVERPTDDPRVNNIDLVPVLQYEGEGALAAGHVGIANRRQPTLEAPEVNYLGRSMYFSFGMEGVNNDTGHTTREELLQRSLNWAWDAPQVELIAEGDGNTFTFTAMFTSNIEGVTHETFRWDYGDGTPYEGPYASNSVTHIYTACDENTVARVEVVDSLGNHAVASVTGFCEEPTAISLQGIEASGRGVNPLWLAALITLGAGSLALWTRRRKAA